MQTTLLYKLCYMYVGKWYINCLWQLLQVGGVEFMLIGRPFTNVSLSVLNKLFLQESMAPCLNNLFSMLDVFN